MTRTSPISAAAKRPAVPAVGSGLIASGETLESGEHVTAKGSGLHQGPGGERDPVLAVDRRTALDAEPGPADATAPAFSARVRQGFGRGAASYEQQARLQQGVAWRLAHHCRDLPLPAGARADLGAGTGLLSRALLAQRPVAAGQTLPAATQTLEEAGSSLQQTGEPLQQIDLCPELLARNPLAGPAPAPWDLNGGLPPQLREAALLISSFALQWLDDPARELGRWAEALTPGGWLAVAVPVAGSFPTWQAAARAAGVPCGALPLPRAETLLAAAAAAGLELRQGHRLRFSRPAADGLATLRLLRSLGATASRRPPLPAGQLRRLLACWPAAPLRWEVLLLLARRPHLRS